MTMKRRQNKILKVFLGIAIFILIFSHFFSAKISPFLTGISGVLFEKAQVIKDWKGRKMSFLKEKENLYNENILLKEKNSELEFRIFFYEILFRENLELKTLLGRENQNQYILVSVVARPPQLPYDILIVDAGSEQGIKKGANVSAYSHMLLGYAEDVFDKTAKIKLISFPGTETNVYLENSKISAVAVGMGNGNMEIKLPASLDIKEGDIILSAGTFPFILGTAEKKEIDESEGAQKIFFRLPVNLQEIKYLLIEK